MISLTFRNVSEAAPIPGPGALQPPTKAEVRKASRLSAVESKKDRLLALIAKPSGAKISLLSERLGWQAHTVRAALSRLRRNHQILTTKAPKTGEAVYRLLPPPNENLDVPQVAALEV